MRRFTNHRSAAIGTTETLERLELAAALLGRPLEITVAENIAIMSDPDLPANVADVSW